MVVVEDGLGFRLAWLARCACQDFVGLSGRRVLILGFGDSEVGKSKSAERRTVSRINLLNDNSFRVMYEKQCSLSGFTGSKGAVNRLSQARKPLSPEKRPANA